MCIPRICTKRKPLTKAGRPNILVHVVASYNVFQAVLGFLCHCVLCFPNIHAHVDVFVTYNGMVRGYTENLVIRRTLIIKCIIFCCDHLLAHVLNKQVLQYAHPTQNYFYLQHSHTIAGQQRMKQRLKESSTDLSSMAYPKLPHEESMDFSV